MNYNIKGTDIDISDEVRAYVEKKLAPLDKMVGSDAARVDVVVAHTATADLQYTAEMTLHDAKMPLHAESRGSTLHEAIDIVSGELSDVLANTKNKKLSNFRHSAVKVKEFLRGWRQKI